MFGLEISGKQASMQQATCSVQKIRGKKVKQRNEQQKISHKMKQNKTNKLHGTEKKME